MPRWSAHYVVTSGWNSAAEARSAIQTALPDVDTICLNLILKKIGYTHYLAYTGSPTPDRFETALTTAGYDVERVRYHETPVSLDHSLF